MSRERGRHALEVGLAQRDDRDEAPLAGLVDAACERAGLDVEHGGEGVRRRGRGGHGVDAHGDVDDRPGGHERTADPVEDRRAPGGSTEVPSRVPASSRGCRIASAQRTRQPSRRPRARRSGRHSPRRRCAAPPSGPGRAPCRGRRRRRPPGPTRAPSSPARFTRSALAAASVRSVTRRGPVIPPRPGGEVAVDRDPGGRGSSPAPAAEGERAAHAQGEQHDERDEERDTDSHRVH